MPAESQWSDADQHDPLLGDEGHLKYVGEDTRPTSKRELAGWYSYGWAAEVFVVCAMGEMTTSLEPQP